MISALAGDLFGYERTAGDRLPKYEDRAFKSRMARVRSLEWERNSLQVLDRR
jgi:hypothetical protein